MLAEGFCVVAGAGCHVNPDTGEEVVVGILSLDLPFWGLVTSEEMHRKSLNLEPNGRQGWVCPYGAALGQATGHQHMQRKCSWSMSSSS